MKFVDEFRSSELATTLAREIAVLAGDRPVKIMEVCGGILIPSIATDLRTTFPRTSASFMDRAVRCA